MTFLIPGLTAMDGRGTTETLLVSAFGFAEIENPVSVIYSCEKLFFISLAILLKEGFSNLGRFSSRR